jgi:histidinol-phosphate aminotransferase
MSVSRRSFVATLGAGTAAALALPSISWRGREGVLSAQGTQSRRADRLMAARPGMIRIDSNENPNGPGEHVFTAIRNDLGESNRYPVKGEDDLIAAIAAVHGIPVDNIILGCGSGELLRVSVLAFTNAQRGIVVPEPTFESPANFAKFIKSPVIGSKVDAKLQLDLDGMADASRANQPGLVYFCNPNNPTATVHGASNVKAFIDRVNQQSPETTILVDEAYHEYVADKSYATAIPLALANPRVIVTRTFSKVFGMAGLRVGYAIGQKETLAKMQSWLLGSNVNQLALAAATTAVADTKHIAAEQRRNAETRAATRKFFEQAGYTLPACDANFMMVDIKRDVKLYKSECLKHDVAIGRQFPALPTHARISFGTMAEMQKAFAVFKTTLA